LVELLDVDRGALGRAARAGRVDRLATHAWPTLFGDQFLYEIRPA
jgi:hypothetical protein